MTTSNFCFIKGLMCIRKIIFLYSCISLIGGCGHLLKSSAHIKNSFESIKQIQVPAATQGTLHCNQIIAPVIDVPGITFYKDIDRSKGGHASIIDPEKMAIRNALVKPISDFNFQIDGLADQIWREQGTNQTTVTCFIDSLHLWAKAEALLGEATEQGEFERNWALSGIALAYLKASPFLKAGDPQKQLVIQLWMEKIAHKVQLSFDDHIERVSRKNNLSVWAGLAVQATSVKLARMIHQFYQFIVVTKRLPIRRCQGLASVWRADE